jgi:uncharacterized RDD family membrane protein YckC
MAYDGLLVVAIWMLGSLPLVMLTGASVDPGNLLYQAYLSGLAFGYFHLSWSGPGQTLGMRSWRLHLVRDDPARPMLQGSLLRFGVALVSALCFGLGFLSSLIRPDRRTWHDRASGSRLEFRPRVSASA